MYILLQIGLVKLVELLSTISLFLSIIDLSILVD